MRTADRFELPFFSGTGKSVNMLPASPKTNNKNFRGNSAQSGEFSIRRRLPDACGPV
jgi:hypothetical protein